MNKLGVTTEKSQESHLSIDDIIKYLEKPDSPLFFTTRNHLLNCTQCLQQVHSLSQLEQKLVMETHVKPPALISYNLRSPNLDKYRPSMHLLSVKKIQVLGEYVWRKLNTSQPIWKPITVFAGIAALYFSLMMTDFKSPVNPSAQHLVTYQDSGYLEYTQERNTPGIGFFGGTMIEKTPVKMPVIHWHNNTLTLSWDKISDIEDYVLEISTLSEGKKNIVAYLKSNVPMISFENVELNSHRRYLYIISGKTTSNKNFKTSGGFIISD